MRKIGVKRRLWLDKRSRKLVKQIGKRKKKLFHTGGIARDIDNDNDNKGETLVVHAPEKFDLIENAIEMVSFFQDVRTKLSQCRHKDTLFFDLSNVKQVGADAVMYVIALMHNSKHRQLIGGTCEGNYPLDVEASRRIRDTGFFEYVKCRKFPECGETNCVRIVQGKDVDQSCAGRLCRFVHDQTNGAIDRLDTKRLYAMLVELMSNTKQHAYEHDHDAESKMISNWYVFAEEKEKCVQFVFLDTGMGIPRTIRKTRYEKVRDFFEDKDALYIASALKGEFRTETKQEHRGKGLPEIYNNACRGKIDSLEILSGTGRCVVKSNGDIEEFDLGKEFIGTMFAWNILKEV